MPRRTYTRVCPRDLFNESKLLKCLGRLAVLIHERAPGTAGLSFKDSGDRFEIEQDPSDASLYVTKGVKFFAGPGRLRLRCNYNDKSPYPLFCLTDDDGVVGVFNDDGNLTAEFIEYVLECVNGNAKGSS